MWLLQGRGGGGLIRALSPPVIMTAFLFSCFTLPVASHFLKTLHGCLHFVPLFLKLFASASLGFFFLEVLFDYCSRLLLVVPDISFWVVPLVPFM